MKETRTLRQIWDSVPFGQSISNPDYLKVCDYLESTFKISLKDYAKYYEKEIWNMTPSNAILNIECNWRTREYWRKYDENVKKCK